MSNGVPKSSGSGGVFRIISAPASAVKLESPAYPPPPAPSANPVKLELYPPPPAPSASNPELRTAAAQPRIAIGNPGPYGSMPGGLRPTTAKFMPAPVVSLTNGQAANVIFLQSQSPSGTAGPYHPPRPLQPTPATASTSDPSRPTPPPAASASASPSPPVSAQSDSVVVNKCTSFLKTLIKLSEKHDPTVKDSVIALVQGLLSGRIQPEDFTKGVQRELKSSAQPHLVPFLQRALPPLRGALKRGEVEIEGIRVEVMGMPGPALPYSVGTPQPSSSGPQPTNFTPPISSGPRQMMVRGGGTYFIQTQAPQQMVGQQQQARPLVSAPFPSPAPAPRPIRPPTPAPSISAPSPSNAPSPLRHAYTIGPGPGGQTHMVPVPSPQSHLSAPAPSTSNTGSTPEKFKDESGDDLNDVTAMGGVNLQEESRALASAALPSETRSLGGSEAETEAALGKFFSLAALRSRLAERSGMNIGRSAELVVGLAVERRLRDWLAQLTVIATHRSDLLRRNPFYEASNDVRGQLRWLEEVDRLEGARRSERDRELLLKMSKSRGKLDEADAERLKARAKEMQKQEEEDARKRDANAAAQLALAGNRKRPAPVSQAATDTERPSSSVAKMPRDDDDNAAGPVPTFSTSLQGLQTNMAPASASRWVRVQAKDLQLLLAELGDSRATAVAYRALLNPPPPANPAQPPD